MQSNCTKYKKSSQMMNKLRISMNRVTMKCAFIALFLLCVLPVAQSQVKVGGGVFGGGRMADVGGKTDILVKGQSGNADSLGGVYGGNDIAGSVNGAAGSNIVLGADALTSSTGNGNTIVITEVYGGGNGYYQYPGLAGANTGLGTSQSQTTSGSVKNFDGTGEVATVAANTKVPSIQKTSIKVYGSKVKITDLFGGAKNAFVTNTGGTTANIDIKSGTITNAFGGNNYGGNLTGNIAIAVSNTTLPASQVNASYPTVGDTWGIKYLYGGGNKVVVPGSVTIDVTGGLIETCFAGGNAATVQTSTVTLNTTAAATYTRGGADYDGVSGFYNIRTLYGGNNLADMNGMPTLNLAKGGVGTVYGGGKMGSMMAGNTSKVSGYALSTYVNASSNDFKADILYGGCQQADVQNGGTYVAVSQGEIGNVYGGCNISGTVDDINNTKAGANVVITGGTIHKNVYGGSNGYYGFRDANTYKYINNIYNSSSDYTGTQFPLVNTVRVNITGGTIEGNVYSGGNLAPVGIDRAVSDINFAQNTGSVTLDIAEGGVLIKGNVFGGGRMAPVYGKSHLTLDAANAYNGTNNAASTQGVKVLGDIYGGNDIAGSITVAQDVTGSDTKTYSVATAVSLTGAIQIEGSVFGGGNGDYTYFNTAAAYESSSAANKVLVANVSDKPVVEDGALVDVHTGASSHISKVYGGGNNATVNSRATVLFNVAEQAASGSSNVDTIFGGNNLAAMSIKPDIDLQKGTVGTVYGGGNRGRITCTTGTATSPSAGSLTGLSTYVLLAKHDNLEVTGTIYGGCRVANVSAKTYVDLYDGVAHDVFGGNDVGGEVSSSVVNLNGNARVSNIYGGGNGKYYYAHSDADNANYAYKFSDHSSRVSVIPDGEVYTTNAQVLLTDGSVTGDVYGGGLAGNGAYTDVVVESGAEIGGTMYGGGCGHVEYLGTSALDHPHAGNVDTKATLTINGLGAELKRAYGGGRMGDVQNTEVVVKDAVNKKIKALYGGCMASNLNGTATITVGQTPLTNGETPSGTIVLDTLYGGNDFSGKTANTNIVINQGTFVHVFGAGNGDYDYKTTSLINRSNLGSHGYDTVPYSLNVNVVYNGGYFKDRVFGGGNMGLVGDKSIRANNYPEGGNNSSLYGHINVDIHDGYFAQHVFAGARGSLTMRQRHFGFTPPAAQPAPAPGPAGAEPDIRDTRDVKMLAYAYKQVNMDGGVIRYSLYGGSEAVDDGYPYECWDNVLDPSNSNMSPTTSMRPSTVINIVGGSVMNRVYGGGYRGNVYGSIYVNVGEEAVVNCPVWTKVYQRSGSNASATFGTYLDKATSLNKSPLYLLASIYNGSDWGEAGQAAYFDTRGFFGGIGLIFIDGEGYQTSISKHSLNPEMMITNSIIGAGTSTREADVNSRIIIRNYGDFYCPAPSRSIKSVQRTNRLFLHNVYLNLTGEQDAFQSYNSSSRSFCRIDTIIFHEQNLAECAEPSEFIGMVRSEDHDSVPYTNSTIFKDAVSCPDEGATSTCDLLSTDVLGHNVLLLDNGTYFQIFPYTDVNENHIEDNDDPAISTKHDYGELKGWMYLMAPNGTRATVMSRPKNNATSNAMASALGLMPAGPLPATSLYASDGGFVCPCSSSNLRDSADVSEVAYGNVTDAGETYRTWTVGSELGDRRRHITMVAHADPSKVTEDHLVLENGSETGFAYAQTTLVLPPSSEGHYYNISSVSVDDDNGGQVSLVDFAYDPSANSWVSTFQTSSSAETSKSEVAGNPNYTFGLQFQLGNNFDHNSTMQVSNGGTSYNTMDQTVVSGNSNLSTVGGFYSKPIVSGATSVLPTLDFVLTYNTNISTTVTRDVVFRMEEYDANNNYVGPVDITVTISTVITDFNNLEAPVLAMFNENSYDQYVRKVIIPASFLQRNLYLDSIRWAPSATTDHYCWDPVSKKYVKGTGTQDENRFHLQAVGDPINDYTHFSVSITPTQDVTDNISNSLGWYDVQSSARNMDIYSLGQAANGDKSKYGYADFVDPTTGLGKHIGVLDGRAAAAFDVTLNFEGSFMYEDVLDMAHFKLYFHYVNTQDDATGGHFTVDIKLRTRQSGDTIYMAEPDHFYAYTVNNQQVISSTQPTNGTVIAAQIDRYTADDLKLENTGYKKNDPKMYLHNFQRAIDVYDEGDVICILDPIHINNNQMPISIQGADYNVINIIRYTGSHFHWPGEKCAYRGPMIVVSDGAKFTASNVRIDGGGGNRKAKYTSVAGTTVPHEGDGVSEKDRYVQWNGQKYMYYQTERDTTFAHAPVFWVEDGSRLNLRNNVTIVNNFNNLNWNGTYPNDALIPAGAMLPGGAIGGRKTNGGAPTIMLGDMCSLDNNVVVDHSTSHDPGVLHTPGNYGAAIFSDGANVTLGNGKNDNVIQASQSFYVPVAALTSASFSNYFATDDLVVTRVGGGSMNVPRYKFHSTVEGIVPTNIYLTRTRATSAPAPAPSAAKLNEQNQSEVMYDTKTDLISVVNQLGSDSRIGVTKWFPGYRPTDNFGRDTIGIVNYAVAGSLAALNNYNSNIFSDDSAHVLATSNYYRRPSSDNVDVRYSSLLNTTKIYLHRCGTFYEAETPVVYKVNPDVICPGDGDTIWYHVVGGAASYTYSWQLKTGSEYNEISSSVTDQPSGFVVPLGLSLAPGEQYKEYQMRVEATEAGGCKNTHDIDVIVKRVGSALENGSASSTDYALGRYDAASNKYYSYGFDDFMGYTHGHAYDVPGAVFVSNNTENTAAKAARFYSYYTVGWNVEPAGSGTITGMSEGGSTLISDVSEVCPGDQIRLNVTPASNYEFVMWDDDPSQPQNLLYVITHDKDHLTAYLSPSSYWWRTVTSDPGSSHYVREYHGNVHVYDSLGLAWLISTTNGLNGEQARTYANDTIFIHQAASGAYNMKNHRWTPLGTSRYPFRGTVIMEDSQEPVSHLVVNEDYASYLGMFGCTDSAEVRGIKLRDCVISGLSYAGGIAGYAGPQSVFKQCDIDESNIITANNCAGGIVGNALNVSIDSCSALPTLVGNILHAGGLTGKIVIEETDSNSSSSIVIANNSVGVVGDKLSSLYLGGVAGSAEGVTTGSDAQGAKGGHANHVVIANNCVSINSSNRSFYVGGLVGNAQGVDMMNNYAYGSIDGFSANGGLVGWAGDQVSAENCYYAESDAKDFTGTGRSINQHNTATFSGEGSQVTLSDSINGTSNLTIALNQWVRSANASKAAAGSYKTWRSDLEHLHDGYPVFGTPDNIPVYDTVSDVACDSYTWYDSTYTVSGTYSHTESDSANFIDNITVMNLTVHYSQSVEISDSVLLGSDYFGENYTFTAEEIRELLGDDTLADVHTLQIVDSLLTENGCDSVVVFNLVVYGDPVGLNPVDRFAVSVYPNPTAGRVEVKADALQRVEIYDAVSRKVMDQQGVDGKCLFDLSNLSAGSYYFRIHSAHGVAVKKVVKR